MTNNRSYPRTVACAGGEVVFRLLTPDDGEAVLAFAQKLSAHDLLFLRRDISQPKVVAAWMDATRRGGITTVLAVRDGAVLGCATIVRDALSWSRHVGELRVILEPGSRGQGLGGQLTHEAFALAIELGVEKLMAQMTVDQRGAIGVFEGLGFRAEALLHDHVKDREGRTHDIVILAHDVAKFQAQMAAYGLTEALE
ncbi:Putative phosphinothricin acetyltransferase YwnH [Variovorax sp. SRS16]|uniref:GNAT family N-acetyltransferase n=1 Tax=Variovorax sp. SRS16 TaxID=282217 RepID=UPI0013177134|nr:GNAT family N-acetyltransferase [Variovorax sp. SRS16]VTU25654.1 Putative phosphinothricin acetyltransferase YwnH [Variovorax sp. SRS16]